ncbi:tetratricopeptide repeat-containing sulfotransferase family protein [Solimicrobium silvestre]|uniref:Sulfotransferase domain n=1 Tax=Solimicrobium silvestre TaxID=2099400 RepID=A0A2S9H288_9BURK|nr:tetratricopeptide repeat-containing sulfotransferase family protein [Solimicrobium silvestre]PRC94063.1 Sulfotransferase domain [Solimicrobium silvestre]
MHSRQNSPNQHQTEEPSQAEIANLLALFTQQHYAEAKACADKLTHQFPQHGFTWKALGAIHKKLGNPEEAITALTKATLFLPTDADVHYNLGNSFLEQSKLSQAESSYRQALVIQPGYMAAHYNLGKVYQASENFDAAQASYRIALSLQPDFVEALSSLGVVLHSLGKIEEGEIYLRRAAEINPNDPQNHTNLANLLQELGNTEQAESLYRQALKINPYSWQPIYNLANLLINQKHLSEAETMYVQVVQLRPEFAEAWFNLGNCLFAQNRHPEAEISYREALRINPDYAEAHNHLGIALREQERLTEAEQSYRNALRLKPDYVDVHYNLGNALSELDRIPEAEVCYHRALEFNPDYAEAHNNLGIALKTAGRLEEAKLSLEKAMSINPEFLEPYVGIASLKTYRENDPQIALLEKQLATVHELKPEAQIRFWFAIGKMYEDLGRFDASFSAYEKGNRLKFSSVTWDEEKEIAFIDRIKKLFTKVFFDRSDALADMTNRQPTSNIASERTPIFILGMPRSGTSLLEQILSTHPSVFGAGELVIMKEVIVNAALSEDYLHYPDAIANFSLEQWHQLGQSYLDKVWELAPHSSHITDKMPANFLHIGMIHLMFPNAKIIHAMRDPMDSCFSCYSRIFSKNNLAFSYDLNSLGHYYNRYITLMEHWHTVLPAGTILDCRYEDLVENTEAQAKRILHYIGLPWDERCLDFHKNKRRVKTASQAQVQKPIYKSSVARWKHYKKYLGPLEELINRRNRELNA